VTEKPYHHGALDEALTEAAMEIVRTSGIAALSLRDLARAVGVSPSATYRHFPSRDHLVAHVSKRCREEFAQALIDARETTPAAGQAKRRSVERFRAIGRAYIVFAIEHPTIFEAAFTPCDAPREEDDPSAWQVLVDAIDEMVGTGAVPAARRKDAPIIAWSGVHGLANIVTNSIWPPGMSADNEIDAVTDGIYRAIS
jgi:AcrR family transcriptional regulator